MLTLVTLLLTVALTAGSLELFFTSSRSTPTSIYHSRCELEAP